MTKYLSQNVVLNINLFCIKYSMHYAYSSTKFLFLLLSEGMFLFWQ